MGSKRKRNAGRDGLPTQKKAKVESHSDHAISKSEKKKLFENVAPFSETLSRDDHERERLLYKLLGSEDVEDRIGAAGVIVTGLLGDDGVSEAVLRRHLERRLFRGLASGNDAARVGFSYALAEILSQLYGEKDLAALRYPNLDFVTILQLLVEKTHAVGNVPGQEERDHYWGQLFGLQSFVQAGILFGKSKRWHAVLDLLLKASKKKVWLRPQTGFVIAQAVPQMPKEEVQRTLTEVTDAGLAKTPEGLGIWLVAADRFPDLKLPKPWTDPFATKSLQEVAAVLKGAGKDETDGSDKAAASGSGSAMTQLSFTWDLILNRFVKQATSGVTQTEDDFQHFWDRVVDQSYFSKNASDFQKTTGFKLFQKFYREAASQSEMLHDIFSKNLMTCIMNQTSNAGTRLHRTAVQLLKSLEKTVETQPLLLAPTLRGLLGKNGVYNFDERVEGGGDGVKPVEKLLRHTAASNAKDVIKVLQDYVLPSTDDDEDAQKRLQTYADYLAKLISKTGLSGDDTAPDAPSAGGLALQELANLAYSKPGKGSTTAAVQEAYRAKLTSAVGTLLKRPGDFPALCSTILSIDTDSIAMADEIKSELVDACKRLRKLVKKCKGSSGGGADQGLAVLHAVAILQLYNDPASDAVEVLGDTKQCYEKLHGKAKGDDSDVSEILVEVLLSMLAGSSTLTRNASIQVFESFSSFISQKALELLADILPAEESQKGLNSIFNVGDDEMEDEDMEDDDDDVEEISMQDAGSEADSEDDDSEADEAASESEDDDEDESGDEADADSEEKAEAEVEARNDESLEALLMKTFNVTHTLDKDNEAESSDDDADMSDSEMLALDEQLSGHLKLIKSKSNKKDREGAKKKVIEFKHRVLDLIDVYVKKEAPLRNGLVFTTFVPLLHLIQTTKEVALSHKAVKIISEAQKLLKKAKKNDDAHDELDVDKAIEQLEQIHQAANDASESKAFALALSSASLAIATTLFAIDRENYRRIADVYRKTQDRFILENLELRPSFFTDWCNWLQAVRSAAKSS